MTISVIHGCVDATKARGIVEASGREVEVSSLRELWYPYHWFLFRSAGSAISCLVDARTGRGATSDRFVLDAREASSRDVLVAGLSADDALARARGVAVEALVNRRRTVFAPRLELVAANLVYKTFWVVRCENRAGAFSVLVDGTNGGFHPLALDAR